MNKANHESNTSNDFKKQIKYNIHKKLGAPINSGVKDSTPQLEYATHHIYNKLHAAYHRVTCMFGLQVEKIYY